MVTTERHVVIGKLADAGCTHTSYCCAITNTQVGEKLPIQLSTP